MEIETTVKKLFYLREEKKEQELSLTKLKADIAHYELEVLALMSGANILGVRTQECSVAINKTVLPNVTDWEEFYTYLNENKAYYLLQKRVSSSAYRELRENKEIIPGVEDYNKTSLRFTKSN